MISALAEFLDEVQHASNPEQKLVETLGLQAVLVQAPAGCGKTEILAKRARALVAARVIIPPRQLLALTFSNRARDNLQARLRDVLGPRYWVSVSVTNFHGFASRLILSHGEVEGLDPDEVVFPQRGWLKQARMSLGIDWQISDRVDQHLRAAKSGGASDEEVLAYLEHTDDREALEYERHLRTESRLDYDDLLRYASRILAHNDIAHLYACRFPGVLVDEVQDLTLQQLGMATAIAPGGFTAVGDLAQGIYTFAGAEPDEVLARIDSFGPARIQLRLSYRSAPRILAAVNVVARLQGQVELECADPTAWNTDGEVEMLSFDTAADEGDRLVAAMTRSLATNQKLTIGVITRRGTRADQLRESLEAVGVDFEDWRDAAHNRQIVRLLRRKLKPALAASDDPKEQIRALSALCRQELTPEDGELLDDLEDALATATEAVDAGEELQEWVKRCREVPPRDAPVGPGIHLLTAHSGKGQQFDWVVALGLEEDVLPDFREVRKGTKAAIDEELRVLHVMVSRARTHLTLTRVRQRFNSGRWWDVHASRWWSDFEAAQEVTSA